MQDLFIYIFLEILYSCQKKFCEYNFCTLLCGTFVMSYFDTMSCDSELDSTITIYHSALHNTIGSSHDIF